MSVYLWPPLLRAADALGAPALLMLASGQTGGPTRVLLVEDDEAIAAMYRLQLEADGYEVAVARDGERGLQMLLTGDFDLALIDIWLPRKDGFELVAESRLRGLPTPMVFVTNFGSEEMRTMGARLGAVDYVVKSQVTPEWVSKRIPRWIGD